MALHDIRPGDEIAAGPLDGNFKYLDQKIASHLADYEQNAIKRDGSVAMTAALDFRGSVSNNAIRASRGGADSETPLFIDFPDLTNESGGLRLFRNSNFTGTKYFEIFQGNNTNQTSFAIRNGRIEILGSNNVYLTSGSGSPEGVVAAPVGSLYQRTNGGASTTLYVKESGTGNTGWKAVQTA